MMLAMVPWGRCKPVGLSDSEPFHTLWRFVGAHWLSGSQMNDMLELLRNKVNTIPESIQNTRIWGTALVPKILAAYRAADAGTYWTAPDLRWIRDLRKDVVQSRAALITSGHLGLITDELHWVAVVFDMTQPVGLVRYGDSFGGEIPEELAAACHLPIALQEDGYSCGILVDNAQQHFVDPSVPLLGSAKFLDARLEVFNKLCVRALEQLELERALAIAEDEDSDERSDQNTATYAAPNDSDSDSDTPILLRRTAKNTKFTFISPISVAPSSSIPDSPARVTGSKRPKGHPGAPTPNPSPQKHRLFKRQADESVTASAQPLFAPQASTFTRSTAVDVFGHRGREDYGADSEEASGSEWGGCDAADTDVFSWSPQDDAPVPPESQMSTTADDTSMESDAASVVDGSEGDASDSAHRAHTNRPSPRPVSPPPKSSKCVAAAKGKITGYWKVETAAEKAVRLEKDAREYAEHAERARLREVEETRKAILRARESGNERMRRHRNRVREEKIAGGWIPRKNKRKRVELADHDEISTPDAELPEHSRPRRQFKEDNRQDNKPCGRKQKPENKKRNARYTNWFHPLLFSQVQAAASRVSKPWKPRAIMQELHRTNLKDFYRLTEQVVGRWIDSEARARGTSKWKDSVLQSVERGKGNAPGGHTTRCGVLYPYPATRKKINDHLTSLRGAGVILTLLSIRGIMVGHIQNDAPELFERTMSDGSKFRCSETFTRRYLHNTLGWSERRTTKAAQKLPANHEKALEEAFFRMAHVIRDYAVPPALIVNTDQTQIVYAQGTGSTWTQRGVKQVAAVGQEEKRAFTLVPSISASASRYDEAVALGYVMIHSGTATYWCNLGTMYLLVDDIIAPYFEAMKMELGLPSSQVSI
ncbi:hypothetical protein B0H14DRAFT_3556186 [Mycena olivaceomarginata]|nr:hypothetical protein B0H14DRAFT_3556186 [Mycena olivaceomarginata]